MSQTRPADDANVAPSPGEPKRRGRTVAAALVALVAIVAATVLVLSLGGGSDAAVTLRSLGSAGEDPFTPAIAPAPSASLSDFADNGVPGGAPSNAPAGSGTLAQYRTVSGAVPGVFGGSLNEETCDTDQLVAFLNSEPDKAQAWATVLGMDVDNIGVYVDTLTGVNLGADTRVLDHGFSNGKLVVRDAVLQRGTAALVDVRGVPRVDCYSGNPLRKPTVAADETFVGSPWPSFDQAEVVVIGDAAQEVQAFELFDVDDGETFIRPTGSTGAADIAPPTSQPSPAPAEPPAPAPTTAPPTPPAVTQDLTMAGDIEVNTTVRGEVGAAQDELIYTVDAPDGAKLLLQVANDRASVGRISVEMRSAGDTIEFFRVPAGGTEEFPLTLSHETGGEYEIIIGEGPGAFEFALVAESQDDAGAGRDAGNAFESALSISSGDVVVGHLAGLDDGDAFLVDLEDAPMLVLTAAAERGSDRRPAFEMQHLGESLDFFRVNPADEETIELLFSDEDDILEIYVTEGPAEYSFTAELTPQRDGGQPGDAPAELPDARLLDSVESFSGQVGDRDVADYYLFDAPADRFTIEVESSATALRALGVDVLGPDGVRVQFFRVQPGAVGSVEVDGIEGDRYRLVLSEGRSTYQVSIS